MGNRLSNVEPGAMSLTSRIGNPILSGFLNMLYGSPIGDAHCGMRAFRRDVLPRLDLRSTGMEFASEMVIRASREDLVIRELPIALHQRSGESKLSPFRDGWRHLRLMLVYCPNFLFMIPGIGMVALGLVIDIFVLSGASVFGRRLYIHAEIGGSLLVIVGVEVIALGLIARTYGMYYMGVHDPFLERMRARFRLEHGLMIGGPIILVGLVGGTITILHWLVSGAGELGPGQVTLIAATGFVVGVQIFFTSFLLSILGLRADPWWRGQHHRHAAPQQPAG
jgi:hypothetical protein